jgi:hypothetical protein
MVDIVQTKKLRTTPAHVRFYIHNLRRSVSEQHAWIAVVIDWQYAA